MSRNPQPPSPLEGEQREPSSPITEKPQTEGRARSNPPQSQYRPLGFDDLVKQVQNAANLKPGDWQVVVSQRAIKHIKQFTSDKSDLSLLIEKKIKYAYLSLPELFSCFFLRPFITRQLSVGYFPAPNQTNLLSRDFGVPIYTADVNEELRLIYQIDFGTQTSTGHESQCPLNIVISPKDCRVDLPLHCSHSHL